MDAFDEPQYGQSPQNPPAEPPPKGWFARNWVWVVPVGCLLPVLLCGGLITSFVYFGMQAVKKIDVYEEAVAMARSNPDVVAALGEPIESGMPLQFQYRLNGNSGSAEFQIPLTGSRSSGTLQVDADRVNGVWNYQVLEVRVTGQAEPLDIRPASKSIETVPTKNPLEASDALPDPEPEPPMESSITEPLPVEP